MRSGYFSTLWRRAWKDTWELVVGFPLASILIAAVVTGLSIYIQHRPWNEMKETLLSLGVGIASSSIVFLVVFLFHFLVLTPKHLYADVHAKVEEAQTQLDQLKDRRPDFFYQGIGSEINHHIKMKLTSRPIVRIDFLLRFQNKGATAYNISSKTYACWINDGPPKAHLADSTEPVRRQNSSRRNANPLDLLHCVTR